MITKMVLVAKVYDYKLLTVLNRIIDTMSLKTPSPKMQE